MPESGRLLLCPFEAADEEALFQQWNEPEVRRYLFDGEAVPLTMVREQIEASRRSFQARGFGFFTLRLRTAPEEVVGFSGLRPFGEPERIELLYALLPACWGRGLATEASRTVLDLAFQELGLSEVWAGADPPNARSIAVMERLGFHFVEEVNVGSRPARYFVCRGRAGARPL